MQIELAPVIPEGLVEFLRQSFPDKAPTADDVNSMYQAPLYRAGVEAVIMEITNHYHSQQET